MDLMGKRLLFLGAQEMMCSAVIKAKELGIYTIVADYNEDFPAKRIADESVLISTSDIDGLLWICREKKVDGVFSGYSELNQFFTLELCEKGNYPYYATRDQVETLAVKDNFKRCCTEHDILGVPEFRLEGKINLQDIEKMKYPVIVKPVDSYSGKGITICSDASMVQKAVDKAKESSKSGRFIVEKYMDDEHFDVITAYYSIQNGEIALDSMVDRYMYNFDGTRRLNTALLYPSQYLDRFIKEVDSKIKNMLRHLGVKNGTLFIEGCVNKDNFWFWEAGFRLCGAQQHILPSHICGVDIQEMLICHALTGQMADEDKMKLEDPYFRGKVACNGVVFINKGKIAEISGINEIRNIPGVVNFSPLRSVGNEIDDNDIGTLNQSFARFHVIADNKENLFKVITAIYDKLNVTDINGENMVMRTFDFDEMRKEKRWARKSV